MLRRRNTKRERERKFKHTNLMHDDSCLGKLGGGGGHCSERDSKKEWAHPGDVLLLL